MFSVLLHFEDHIRGFSVSPQIWFKKLVRSRMLCYIQLYFYLLRWSFLPEVLSLTLALLFRECPLAILKGGLADNQFSPPASKNVFIFPLRPWDLCASYRIHSWHLHSFSTWKMCLILLGFPGFRWDSHCHLNCSFSVNKCVLSLLAFKIAYFSLFPEFNYDLSWPRLLSVYYI